MSTLCGSLMTSGLAAAAATAVQVISRLAQWRIPDISGYECLRSDAFVFGFWKWHLRVVRNQKSTRIVLFPVDNWAFYDNAPSATFVLRVFSATSAGDHFKTAVDDKVFHQNFLDYFVWEIPETFVGSLVVDVEFLDLKIWSKEDDDQQQQQLSGWPSHDEGLRPPDQHHSSALRYLSRMLTEGVHSDVTITTPDGSLRAHKAMLVSASPVFESMFAHGCREKQTSTIEMTDISSDTCSALLRHIYGSLTPEELWRRRMELLVSADKYFIGDLKGRCEESLMEDVSSDNILERLHVASLFRLGRLASRCWTYLIDFGKILDVRDSMDEFLEHADNELLGEFLRRLVLAGPSYTQHTGLAGLA